MKLKVQAQHLQPGDVTGSGDTVAGVVINSIHWPSSKVRVVLDKNDKITDQVHTRSVYWGKYTMINIRRRWMDSYKEQVLKHALAMPVAEQHELASKLAANCGYQLVAEDTERSLEIKELVSRIKTMETLCLDDDDKKLAIKGLEALLK